jgi:DNA adenine methylase
LSPSIRNIFRWLSASQRTRPIEDDEPVRKVVAQPVVKWAGGKSRLLPELFARLPERWARYFEPFGGGAALFFALSPERGVLGDANGDLVRMYRALASDVHAVIRKLRSHARAHSADYYYDARARWNERRASWVPATGAAAFIYLNKTCYNGLWRVNRAGGFNVPVGRYTNPPICVPDALLAAHRILARTELRCGDYRATLHDAERGDLVYLDPPYEPVTATARFTSYTRAAFGRDDQRALAETARHLVARGCHVVLSNSDTPFTRALYPDFRIDVVRCSRSINSSADHRGDVDELIIVGQPAARPPAALHRATR